MKQQLLKTQYALCVKNEGYAASLERGKMYRVVPDTDAAGHGCIRVIDESGEDYLYPKDYFLIGLFSTPKWEVVKDQEGKEVLFDAKNKNAIKSLPKQLETFAIYRWVIENKQYKNKSSLLHIGEAKNLRRTIGEYFKGSRYQKTRYRLHRRFESLKRRNKNIKIKIERLKFSGLKFNDKTCIPKNVLESKYNRLVMKKLVMDYYRSTLSDTGRGPDSAAFWR